MAIGGYSTLLVLGLSVMSLATALASRIQGEPLLKVCNDSAQYFIEEGQLRKARIWVNRALKLSNPSDLELARAFFLSGELEESEGYAQEALTAYSRSAQLIQQRSSSLEASVKNGIASVLIMLGRNDSVLFYIEQSRKADTSLKNRTVTALLSGRYWQSQNLLEKSLPYYQQSYEDASTLDDREEMALALSGMGSIHFRQDPDMNKVMEYFKKANALCDSAKHANIISRNYARIANAFMVMGKTNEAEYYLLRAKRITDLSGNLPVTAYVLSSLAILRSEQGDIQAAADYAEEPIRIKRKLDQLSPLQNDLINIAEWYTLLGKYDKARNIIKEGIETSKKLGDVVYLQYFYDRASKLDSITGDYRNAYSNLKRSMEFKDSVQSLKRFTAVEEIREKYETGQKEKTIAEKEVVIQQQKYQLAVIIGGSLTTVLLLVFIMITIRNRHKLRLQREKLEQDHLRLQTIVQTQEEVQQSIARDIHDGLVQVLGAAKMSLESVNDNSDKSLLVNRIREASKIMDEACMEARNISHQILPYSLMKDGLTPAMEELLRKSLTNYEFNRSQKPMRFNNDIEINVYRIAQELVNNIVKHSEATYVSVRMESDNDFLKLEFRDNGKGFDVESSKHGVGVTNILTRADLLGGKVEIQSATGKGTHVLLTIPI